MFPTKPITLQGRNSQHGSNRGAENSVDRLNLDPENDYERHGPPGALYLRHIPGGVSGGELPTLSRLRHTLPPSMRDQSYDEGADIT